MKPENKELPPPRSDRFQKPELGKARTTGVVMKTPPPPPPPNIDDTALMALRGWPHKKVSANPSLHFHPHNF